MSLPNVIPVSRTKSLINWLRRPHEFLDECSEAYDDTFTVHFLGFKPVVLLSNPQAIKDVFAADAKLFDTGWAEDILSPFLGSNSLIVLDGDRHKRERKMLMPPFHGTKVKSYGENICQITRNICSQWQPQQTVVAGEAMTEITLEVILQTVFGLREGDRYEKLKSLLISLLDLTGSPLKSSLLFFKWLQKDWGSWSPWGRVVHQRQQVYALLQAEIDERRALSSKRSDDVLSLMLLARDEAGEPMSDIELKDELMTMLFAGYETTAIVLTWSLYWIHKRPDVKQKLVSELNALPKGADAMKIAGLPYLTAVASEVLRLYPIAPIVSPRIATEPVTINGYTFPPKTFLSPCIYSVHHREDIYPDAKQFRPERFLERQFSSSEFIPFGGGNRRCIGYALAKLEINLVLAIILQNRTLKLANDQPVTPRRRGFVTATSNGVPLIVES